MRRLRSPQVALVWLAGLCILFWAAKYHPFLETPRVIDDDARQHVYWTYRFVDPELFRDDLLTAFVSSPQVAPPGYQALYWVGARLMDPLLFSQVLSLLLLVSSVWMVFRLGEELAGIAAAAFAASLFSLFFLYSSSGGLPKSFAFPLLIAGAYLAVRRAWAGLAGLLVLQSVFYPPILVNTMALAGATWLRAARDTPTKGFWTALVLLAMGAGLAVGVLFYVYTAGGPSFGPLITPEEAQTMPEFSARGRTAFHGDTWLATLWNDRAGIGGDRLIGFVLILAVIVLVQLPARPKWPPVAVDLVWTSAILFALAHLVLFRLHLPSRYVLYSLPLALLLLVGANGAGFVPALELRWPGLVGLFRGVRRRWFLFWPLLAALGAGYAVAQNRYFAAWDPLTVRIDADSMAAYRYLETLPKDALIAGHPLEMDNVPLFARRQVLANQELSLPYYPAYYHEVRRRLLDSLEAYYAQDAQVVRRLAERYAVDYVLLDRRQFAPEFLAGPIYYEPFGAWIKAKLPPSPRFVLLEGAVGERVWERGPYLVISLRNLQKGTDGAARR
jgi:hypothetical protein